MESTIKIMLEHRIKNLKSLIEIIKKNINKDTTDVKMLSVLSNQEGKLEVLQELKLEINSFIEEKERTFLHKDALKINLGGYKRTPLKK